MAQKPTLSILTPTIPERKEKFEALKSEVLRQARKCYEIHPTLGIIEFISDNAPTYKNGGPNIGEKRQALLDRAIGEYLCFLDDDEDISPDYIETVLRLCYERKDVGTFNNLSKFDNYWCVVTMSMDNETNEQARPGIIKRRPWHICPVRSFLAKQVKFTASNYGEDWVWFEQVLKECKTEAHVENIIHCYQHSMRKSMSDNVTTAI